VSTITRKAFDWKRSRICMLEVEAVRQSCIPSVQIGLSIVLYMRSLLLVESFDFRPSKDIAKKINEYLFVLWLNVQMKICEKKSFVILPHDIALRFRSKLYRRTSDLRVELVF
jgi:hypothetical protein